MTFLMTRAAFAAGLVAVVLAGCERLPESPRRDVSNANRDYAETLQERLLDARPGDVIEIPEGVYTFERSLSLAVDGVTIRGVGADKTILSFQGQKAGAEGLLVTANGFTLENLAIEDTIGDGVKVNEGDRITFRGVRVEWTNGPATENGAYGIYPVQTTNVLIEDCEAIGASDAGIYVGQSKNVVVRNNRAMWNVAGIEIENTTNADVTGNMAIDNTGGILVFDMPNLALHGSHTRIHKNTVLHNNTKNFGRKGSAVASVPAGTGVVVNSGDEIEIFDNDIGHNHTANVVVSSLFSTGYADAERREGFDPYPEGIFIHDNRFTGGGESPDGWDLQMLRLVHFGLFSHLPDVLWDGYVDPGKFVGGTLPDPLRICLDNGDAKLLNADSPNGNRHPRVEDHRCRLPPLAPVSIVQLAE